MTSKKNPGRPKRKLSARDQKRLEQLAKAGRTAEEIAAELGGTVSRATIGRRVRDLLGARRSRNASAAAPKDARRPKAEPAQLKTAPPEIDLEPSDFNFADLDRELDKAADEARDAGNLATYASLSKLRLTAKALEARLNPPPPPDPNEGPDMVAAAEACRTKLHDLIDRIAADQAEQLAAAPKCPACKQPVLPAEPPPNDSHNVPRLPEERKSPARKLMDRVVKTSTGGRFVESPRVPEEPSA